jgi:predicted transposase YdaD
MKESTTYQAILAEGREEGRVEGQEAGVRATILRLGTKRYGTPSPQTERALQEIHDFERLEQLAERLLEAENWNELMGESGL